MAKQKNVPRETLPVIDLGPMLKIDPDMLEDRLKRMSEKDKRRLLDLLDEYVVVLERERSEHSHRKD
jgi:hypothetical protein